MQLKWGWGAKIGLISAGLVSSLMLMPIPTSLHEGVPEQVVVWWTGIYDHFTGQYDCRFLLTQGFSDVPIHRFPQRWLTSRGKGEFWHTPHDSPQLLMLAYRQNPAGVEQQLGTRDNVAGWLNPFPGAPVAYAAPILRAMAKDGWNPRAAGGPDIPPRLAAAGSEPLQIDTQSNGTALLQLKPGQRPLALPSRPR